MPEVQALGVRLHYQRLGRAEAPAVVFLHGLVMDNLSSWYFSVAGAVAAHADALLYDLRGHGKSERPPTGYTLADLVSELAALMSAVWGDRPVTLVGNSFGGLLAVAFARAFPDRTRGLVLVDAHLGERGFGERMARTLELEGEECDRVIALAFKDWLGRHSGRKRNRLAESARRLCRDTSLIADLRATPPLEPADLAGLAAPVLALYGEHSDLRASSEQLLAAAPACTLRIVPGCTHSLLWEATGVVRAAVDEILDRVSA